MLGSASTRAVSGLVTALGPDRPGNVGPPEPVRSAMRALLLLMLSAAAAGADSGRSVPEVAPDKVAPDAALAPAQAAVPAAAPAADRAVVDRVANAMRWFLGSAGHEALRAAAMGPSATGSARPPVTLPHAALPGALESLKLPSASADRDGNGAPAFGGGWAAGLVVAPAEHPDRRPWPHGMVMTPPETRDANVIAPGGDGLVAAAPRDPPSWSKRITDALTGGISSMLALALPASL